MKISGKKMDGTGNYHIEHCGVNVKGSRIDPCVGTLDLQLMAMLFGKARELLGGAALLEEICHWMEGFWSL